MSFFTKLLQRQVPYMVRNFGLSIVHRSSNLGANAYKVNNLEKRFLVWTGKYKSVEEVPALVASEVVEKARNRMRIRVANIMIVMTLAACLVVSISGKRAHQRGESVQKENEEFHRKYREENK